MQKIINFRPAFDKRNPDPKINYGIHGVEIVWILKGDKGAIQFVVYTNWHLPGVQKELIRKCKGGSFGEFPYCTLKPQPADVGYHSPAPQYEGQNSLTDSCDLLGGKPCYYDGSGLQAEDVFRVLVEQGGEAVWKELEDRYVRLFGSIKDEMPDPEADASNRRTPGPA